MRATRTAVALLAAAGALAVAGCDGSGGTAGPRDRKPQLQDQIMDVLVHIGFVRIRTGKTYDPTLLDDVESARTRLQAACTTT